MYGEFTSLRSQVSQEVGQVSGIVRQMREDERWWNFRGVEFLETEPDEALVRLQWQLKEFTAGSQVTLNYRKQGEEAFTPIDAESQSDGYYYADFPADINPEPTFEIHVTRSEQNRTYSEKTERLESDKAYEYYISVQEDDKLRSSDVLSLNMSSMSKRLFNHLSIGVHLNDELYITLHEDTYDKESKYQVEQAFAEIRKGDTVIQRERLIVNDDITDSDRRHYPEDTLYEARLDPATEYDALYLIVNYKDDMAFEKELDIHFR